MNEDDVHLDPETRKVIAEACKEVGRELSQSTKLGDIINQVKLENPQLYPDSVMVKCHCGKIYDAKHGFKGCGNNDCKT